MELLPEHARKPPTCSPSCATARSPPLPLGENPLAPPQEPLSLTLPQERINSRTTMPTDLSNPRLRKAAANVANNLTVYMLFLAQAEEGTTVHEGAVPQYFNGTKEWWLHTARANADNLSVKRVRLNINTMREYMHTALTSTRCLTLGRFTTGEHIPYPFPTPSDAFNAAISGSDITQDELVDAVAARAWELGWRVLPHISRTQAVTQTFGSLTMGEKKLNMVDLSKGGPGIVGYKTDASLPREQAVTFTDTDYFFKREGMTRDAWVRQLRQGFYKECVGVAEDGEEEESSGITPEQREQTPMLVDCDEEVRSPTPPPAPAPAPAPVPAPEPARAPARRLGAAGEGTPAAPPADPREAAAAAAMRRCQKAAVAAVAAVAVVAAHSKQPTLAATATPRTAAIAEVHNPPTDLGGNNKKRKAAAPLTEEEKVKRSKARSEARLKRQFEGADVVRVPETVEEWEERVAWLETTLQEEEDEGEEEAVIAARRQGLVEAQEKLTEARRAAHENRPTAASTPAHSRIPLRGAQAWAANPNRRRLNQSQAGAEVLDVADMQDTQEQARGRRSGKGRGRGKGRGARKL